MKDEPGHGKRGISANVEKKREGEVIRAKVGGEKTSVKIERPGRAAGVGVGTDESVEGEEVRRRKAVEDGGGIGGGGVVVGGTEEEKAAEEGGDCGAGNVRRRGDLRMDLLGLAQGLAAINQAAGDGRGKKCPPNYGGAAAVPHDARSLYLSLLHRTCNHICPKYGAIIKNKIILFSINNIYI